MAGLSTTNKASDITLYASNYEADSNAATTPFGGVVLSDIGHTTGKWYFEGNLIQRYGSTSQDGIGIHSGTSTLTDWLGYNTNGRGVWGTGTSIATYTNNTKTNEDTSHVHNLENHLRVAVDIGAGKVWLSNITGAWLGGGDPAAGTSPTYTFSPSGTYYAALCPYVGHVSNVTLRNKQRFCPTPEKWRWVAPSGFMAWDSAYTISGTAVDDTGNPCARTVIVFQRSSGLLVAVVTSNATTGAWSCSTPYNEAHTVIFYDDETGTSYNAIVYDRVTPV